jgi:hypothetical protein
MRRLVPALALGALAACGGLDHQNPYDPQTPAAGQARTSFAGKVTAEAVGGVSPSLAGITVSVAGQSYAAVTDAAGSYVISGVPAGTYTLQAVRADYETASVSGVTATLDTGGRTVAIPDLALRRVRATLRGTVSLRLPNDALEASGGADVTITGAGGGAGTAAAGAAAAGGTGAFAGAAVTTPSGDFIIPDVPAPLGAYTLTASKLGYVTQTTTVTFQDGSFVVQTVQLQIDPGAIVGTVLVRGAADSFGVTVRARGATLGGTPWEDTTTSAADGSYRLSGLPAGTYGVTFERGDLVTASAGTRAVVPAQDTAVGLVEVLPATGAISGVMQLPGASSSAGVVITAAGTTASASTVTDAAGAFTLTGLPVGSYTVTARKDPEWQPSTSPGVAVVRDQTTALATSALAPWATASLGGVARLEGATLHSGTTVTLSGTDFRGVAVPPGTTAPTSGTGDWSFAALPAGSYQVTFAHAGFDTPPPAGVAIVTGQAAALGPVTLAASRGAVRGVITAVGAASHAGTVVEIAGGPDQATAVTDALGGWSVSGLRVATTYTATYRRTGYTTPAPAAFTITAGATTDVGAAALALSRTASLSGSATVVRPAGAAASGGILVSLSGTDLNGAAVTGSTSTASGGAFTVGGLPQGTYALTFTKTAYAPQTLRGLAVTDGGAAAAPAVVLDVATGTIAGQVVLSAGAATGFAQGADYSGVVVTLSGLEAGVVVPVAITDASGSFRLEGVPVHTAGSAYGVLAQRSSYTSASGTVTATANATAAVWPSPLTLPVAVGSVGGTVAVNDTGTATSPANGTVTVALTGTAFNSTAFSASAGNIGAACSLPNVPPGTYQVSATSTDRSCTAPVPVTVAAGQAVSIAAPFVCTDAVAPGSVALGVPAGPGADPGYTSSTGVAVPVTTHAFDPTFNVSGYQYVAGGVPSWSGARITAGLVSPIMFPVGTLSVDGTATLWVRAVDRVGNAGPASSVQIVRDTLRPAAVAIATPRLVVNATSTTAIITGGSDANFKTYQACTTFVDPTVACTTTTCGPVDSAPSIAVTFDAPNRKACVYARALDRAGNFSAATTALEVTSDLTPPTGPIIAPLYDPATVTVHADAVDFRITTAARDAPGLGGDWRDIAWVEADTGGGFTPICPQAECHATGFYAPCTCGCSDPRLVCDGSRFAAIRLPLSAGAANQIAVRAVDVAGNVGSGASQQVQTSGILSALDTTAWQDEGPRVRGRTLVFLRSGVARVVDLGADLRWQDTDPVCDISPVASYEFAADPLDSSTLFYTNGSEVRIRRRGASWCSGYTDFAVGTASAGYSIYAVAATYDPATGRVERVAWAENDTATSSTRLWTRDAPAAGRFDGTASPAAVMVHEKASTYTTRLAAGGDVLVVRENVVSGWPFLQYIDGSYAVLQRPAAGWGTATPARFDLPSWPGCTAAAIDSSGKRLAWVTTGAVHTLHVARPGADGLFGTADDVASTRTYASSATYDDVTIEGAHVVAVEYMPNPTGHLTHWTAGPDGEFGTADDGFAQLFPTASYRQLPSLGDGLGGGVVYYSQSSGGNWDLFSADLSQFRWDTLSDSTAVYPRSNRLGTYFFIRNDGVWARAPDGRETTASVQASFYGTDGNVFAAHTGGNIVVHLADEWGRFFTTTAPPGFVASAGKAGASYVGSGTDLAAGGGRVIFSSCEALSGYTCTEDGVVLLEPSPTLTTAVAIRVDRPADGAPPNTSVASYPGGMGVSARHVVYTCADSGAGIGGAICVREPGPNGKFDRAGAPGYDDVTFLLRRPGTGPAWTTYSGTDSVKLDGDRLAFYYSLGGVPVVVAVDAGPDGKFNTADDVETVLGTYTQTGSQWIAVAGNYVAWMTAGVSGGPEPWVGDMREGTFRQLATHYSAKYGITVERSGRVIWEDQVFSTPAVFVCSP